MRELTLSSSHCSLSSLSTRSRRCATSAVAKTSCRGSSPISKCAAMTSARRLGLRMPSSTVRARSGRSGRRATYSRLCSRTVATSASKPVRVFFRRGHVFHFGAQKRSALIQRLKPKARQRLDHHLEAVGVGLHHGDNGGVGAHLEEVLAGGGFDGRCWDSTLFSTVPSWTALISATDAGRPTVS